MQGAGATSIGSKVVEHRLTTRARGTVNGRKSCDGVFFIYTVHTYYSVRHEVVSLPNDVPKMINNRTSIGACASTSARGPVRRNAATRRRCITKVVTTGFAAIDGSALCIVLIDIVALLRTERKALDGAKEAS